MFPSLQRFAPPQTGLTDRSFVDYYYATKERCQLHLALDEQDAVIGSIGIEKMPFEYRGERHEVAFGSNFAAAHSGVGGFLYLTWMKSAPVAMVFGGSADTHNILRAQNWTYYPDVRIYQANMRYAPRAGENLARRLAKRLLRACFTDDVRKRVAALQVPPIEVREQFEYRDALATLSSPFLLRLAPDLEYLRWRYALDLPFAKYRLFEITAAAGLIGYVVLHERANRIVVSHADGSDARLLAAGIMKAVALVSERDSRPREILLTSSHPEMQIMFEASGMRAAGQGRSLALKSRRGAALFAQETSGWLVNFDWGDNSLRPPFGRD
ncbi:MAG TPA: hypothetical protein VM146_07950 [Steroidobacteraceae bacterium]|nr:hypothetical protein [Steroidobacteraceae bacterium]